VTPHLLFFAPSGQGGSQAIFVTVWYIVGFGAIFYFLFIRPQRQQAKRHAEMLAALKKGDEVITAGGIVGEVVQIKDTRVTIRSGEAKLVVERDRVIGVNGAKAEPAPAP
jgi:preprotein translocase subunit YajC